MRWLRWLGIAIGSLILVAAALLWIADTDVGHRWLADRIAEQSPRSGLKVRIGRIDGSIYNRARIRNVRIYDPQGLFFEASEARLDWNPQAWLVNRLDLDSLFVPVATLHRVPKLRPSAQRSAILPGFDIGIDDLRVDTLRIMPGVGGTLRTAKLVGKADIHDGRALITLDASASAGDRIALRLDAEPDRDRFDLGVDVRAPAGGVLGAIAGVSRPFVVAVSGDGRWRKWRGTALASVSGARVAQLALSADAGQFGLGGQLALGSVTKGKLQRLTSPIVRVAGTGTLANRRLDGRLSLASTALTARANGVVDLAENRFDGVFVEARLRNTTALFANMSGGPVDLKARFDGAFASARFDYLLTAPRVAFDRTGFELVRASGQGRFSKPPVVVPIALTAARVTGVGDVAGGILRNLSVRGDLRTTASVLTGDAINFRSDKLSGKLSLFVDLKTGRYDIGIAGQLQRYLIPGLGIVDVKSDLKVVPGENGRGTRIAGRGQAWVRRLDNNFLASLTNGLPTIDTALTRGPDGTIRFTGLTLRSPGITLNGDGFRRLDGSFYFEGSGRQARYGPITRFVLDGRIERPRVELTLASPNDAAGLAGVRLLLDPDAAGYGWRAEGGSTIGRFTANGRILLPQGGSAVIEIATLNASGLKASGALRSVTGGFDGRITLGGSGVSGTLDLRPQGGVQAIEAHLKARDAELEGPPTLSARRASVDGVFLLDPKGLAVEATITGQGLARGAISLARLAANVKLKGGVGEVRAAFAGSRGRAFDLQTVAQVSPDAVQIVGSGTIDRRPVRLVSPAVLSRQGGGWRMQPATLAIGGGEARVSGLFGVDAPAIDVQLRALPLTVLDILSPGLGLGGNASGSVSYRTPASGLPEGRADVRIRGLSRSGLAFSSRPVDVGLTAVLQSRSAALRAVAVSGGQTIARGQARLTLAGAGALGDRLGNAQMFAQLRAKGAADTLWRLIGVETLDISGPVAIGADITGTPNAPQIRGSFATDAGRIESPATGMVLTAVQARGRFGGSTLTIDNFAATAGKDGRVTGRAQFSFSAARGLGMEIDAQAERAALIARDDIAATVTGPLKIRSDGVAGQISGEVVLDRSAYRLGRAAAVAAVPQLNVREINGFIDQIAPVRRTQPWTLAIKAIARNRVAVTGLGIESEWRADLDIGGTVVAPTVRGRANLVRGGYEFAGRRFDLSRGSIIFRGESPPDPILDIIATGDTQGLTAQIRVAGTALKPDIAFSSTPSLPQDELLSRLLFGASITDISAPEAVQLAAAVASLRGGGSGLNPINALRNAIGLDRLRILPADSTTGQGTSIAAGKYLTRRTYVELITDGQGYSATRAEFQVTRWLSLLSTISTIGRQSATVRVSKDY